MKRTFILLFYTLLTSFVFAQKRVVSIKTDKDVIRYIKDFFYYDESRDWDNFQLVNGREWKGLYNISEHLEDSLAKNMKYVGWVKVDLNNDKNEDLVVSGCFKEKDNPIEEYKLLVFLSDKNKEYTVNELKLDTHQDFPLYISDIIFMEDKFPMLRLVNWSPDMIKSGSMPFKIDTVFSFDKYFINYNPHPTSEWINDVSFEENNHLGESSKMILTGMDTVSVADLKMSDNRSSYSKHIRGKIYPDIYNGLITLINYGSFYNKDKKDLTGNYMDEQLLKIKFLDENEVSVTNFTTQYQYTFQAICTWLQDLRSYTTFLYNVNRINKLNKIKKD